MNWASGSQTTGARRRAQLDTDAFKAMLWSHFGAAIRMLENAIGDCPNSLWEYRSETRPYWYLAYHTLFFFDLYLSDSPIGFIPPPPFTLPGHAAKEKIPANGYSRKQLQEHLEYGRKKCIAMLDALTEEGRFNAVDSIGST